MLIGVVLPPVVCNLSFEAVLEGLIGIGDSTEQPFDDPLPVRLCERPEIRSSCATLVSENDSFLDCVKA